MAQAQTPPPAPATVIVSGDEDDPIVVKVGEEQNFAFSAIVTHEPAIHSECTLDTMRWNWSGSGGELTSTDSSANIRVTYTTPGTYTVSASASATYSTSCTVGSETRPGDEVTVSGEAKTYTVKAVAKTWQVHTPVGQDINAQGTIVYNGRIISPVNTVTSPNTTTAYVPVGKSVNFSVEGATDLDLWTWDLNGDDQIDTDPNNGEKGVDSDDTRYAWSGGGTFSSPTDSSSSWSSSETGVFTLTCSIDDQWATGVTGVNSLELGTRNDDPIERSIQVVVYKAEMKVARKGTNRYGSSAVVGAGAIESEIHQADILL